ncbi:DUF4920 domain-containing protein [Hymenobacter sp. 15J16-1T3B]|uniref:DUF4920 domain-containing protein n=1 Tax=Hymenobacter sp. 15J16-1T3B TaxID=2886941 RepID=UPI001D127C19|nr:DUF4920 domain-containing protein [Hymenobacter sp. 15J16-1T3B]MCC3157037.1 DUF4920 domain-containing protein [Hymenobacter sp. 15J16-1T3B]
MKRTLLALTAAAAFFTACQQQTSDTAAEKAPATESKAEADAEAHSAGPAATTTAAGKVYGAAVTEEGAHPMTALPTLLGTQDSAKVKLIGEASDVCQAKGCWMTLATADGKQMRVRFKDYAFFVPKDTKGKTVVIDGWVHREEVSVADQQHYAKDAGKSDKEVAAITKPVQQVNFLADGVLIKN